MGSVRVLPDLGVVEQLSVAKRAESSPITSHHRQNRSLHIVIRSSALPPPHQIPNTLVQLLLRHAITPESALLSVSPLCQVRSPLQMSNPHHHHQTLHPLPPPLSNANMHSEAHPQTDKYEIPPSSAPPSALAAVTTAHPLMSTPAPSSSALHHPAAPSSSRSHPMAFPHTMLPNMPLSYSHPLPSLNPHTHSNHNLNTASVPSMHHHSIPPSHNDYAILPQPAPHSLPHTIHPSHIPHSDPTPIAVPSPPIHPHSILQHHDHITNNLPSQNSALNAVAAVAAAAAHIVVPPSDRHTAPNSVQRLHSNLLHHPSSAPMQSSTYHHSIAHPYPPPVPQPHQQPSPAHSEPAEPHSPDGIGPESTAGAASTIGNASGTSSGNVPDDRAPQNPSAATIPPDVGAIAAPPSSGRRLRSEVGSPSNERPSKRPHRSISHAEKRRLCEISNSHPSAKHGFIANVFLSETGRRIERSTVTRVLQRKDFWMSAGTRDSNRKRLTSPRFPSIEEALFELIRNRARSPAMRASLTDKELMRYSKELAEVMRTDNGSMDKSSPNYAPHLRSFRGSLSWVTSFKKRNALLLSDDHKASTSGPFVSISVPGEALDIWSTDMDMGVATETLQEFTRLEDMYFLEAIPLASSGRPENAIVSSRMTSMNYDPSAAIDEAFGIAPSQNQRRVGSGTEPNAATVPSIDFSTSMLTANTPGIANSITTNEMSNVQNTITPQTGDSYPNMSSAANNSGSASPIMELRHPVEEDTIIYGLFCSNGVGNDKRPPWIVGKKAFVEIGNKEGEVWPGSPVRYFHNKQGWITSRLTRKWMEEFDKTVNRKVVVVTSLLNSCDLALLDLKNVDILPVPRTDLCREKEAAMSWASASASPMYHGIEQMFRAKYRCLVIERFLQQMGEQKPLKDLPMRTVATVVMEAWDKLPVAVIRRAWRELPFLPPKFNRTTNRPRSSGMKPTWGQTLIELNRLLMTYLEAIPSYNYAENIDLRQSDVLTDASELSKYIWLPSEEGPFHPSGSILEFARSVCSNKPAKDDNGEVTKFAKSVERRSFQIENHEDALDAINKLANFIKSDPTLGSQQNLYLTGSLQLDIKKECDRRRNVADAQHWMETNRQRPSRMPYG